MKKSESHHEGLYYEQWMDIYYTLDLIGKLHNEIYKYFFLPLLESEECCCPGSMMQVPEEVKFKFPCQLGKKVDGKPLQANVLFLCWVF